MRADFRAVLGNGAFRALFVAHFASNVGDWLAFMALFSLASFEWGADVLGVSFLAIAYMLPLATVSPVAGVWVDRWDLRRVLVWSDLLRAGIVLGMALSSSFIGMCLLLFLHQTVACFFNPAQHAAIPRLVERRHILAANALNTQAAHFTKILGPGVAGVLVALLGVRGCFYVDAATFAVSGALLMLLPRLVVTARASDEPQSVHRDFRAGVAFLRRAPRVRRVILMLLVCLGALGGFIAVLPVYARDQLEAGAKLMGLLLSCLGVGAVVGAAVVAHTGRHWDKMRSMAGGALGAGLALWMLSQAARAGLALPATVLLGAAVAAMLVPAHALVQEETPAALLGRVTSLSVSILSVAQVTGMGLAGAASRALETPKLLAAMAVSLAAVGAASAFQGLHRRSAG